MRVLFSSMRLTGHIRPLFPYAQALVAQGHEVLFSTPESAAKTVIDAGLSHVCADFPDMADLQEIFAALQEMPEQEKQETVIRKLFAGRYARAALPSLRKTIAEFKPDLIVRESMEFGSVIAAAEADIPIVQVATTSADFEDLILHLSIEQMDQFREDVGLTPDQGRAMINAPTFTAFPLSFETGTSTSAMPPPFRVGAKRLTSPEGCARPDWALDDQRPLVFVTLGTLAGHFDRAPAILRDILTVVSELPIRVLLSKGSSLTDDMVGPTPSNVTVVDWVPEEDIFPIADALICHGGAGTLIAGMTNAVPMVVVPLGTDQPSNAKRIEALGCGVALLEPKTESVSSALKKVLQDVDARKTAVQIADEIAGLPDHDAAVAELVRITNVRTQTLMNS